MSLWGCSGQRPPSEFSRPGDMYGPMAQSACPHCQPWQTEAAFPWLGQEQRTKGLSREGCHLYNFFPPCSSLAAVSALSWSQATHCMRSSALACTLQKRLLLAGLTRTPPGLAVVKQGLWSRAWLWLHTQRLLSLCSSCGWIPVLPGMLGMPEGVDMRLGDLL